MIQFKKFLIKRYPQNYILKNPVSGTLIFLTFCFAFIIIYQPLKTHEAQFLSFAATMAIYCSSFSVFVFVLIKVLKRIKYFSDGEEWSLIKEVISILLLLSGMGVAIYFMGFLLEPPIQRWNLSTFLDSCKIAFLLGIIPFAFFTLSNYRHLLLDEKVKNFDTAPAPASSPQPAEEKIHIASKLKNEELSFYPGQLIYAESDGNYVVFYLDDENRTRKEVIRNSISNIEQQLSKFPFITRTHRAFIVNLKKVSSIKGNTLGYRLKLSGTDSIIPVSRQNIHMFDELMK